MVPLFYVVAVHAVALPDDVGASQRFDRGGRQQVGPTDPTVTPVFAAVEEHTPPDAVVVFFRARTMTLYTDRRTLQLTDVERMLQRADYYAQLRNSDYSQPALTAGRRPSHSGWRRSGPTPSGSSGSCPPPTIERPEPDG